MIQIIKDLLVGKPATSLGILSTATVAGGTMLEIRWLLIVAVVSTPLATFYADKAHRANNDG